jgi:hypothetical protein
MPKIVVGIPCFQSMPPETETDYMRLMYYLGRRYPEHDFFLAIKRKAEQFRARNSIVEAAYQAEADYLWMLDDDHVIDTEDGNTPSHKYEILRRLLEHFDNNPEAGIIGALYYHRGGECRPVLMVESEEGRYRYLRDDEITHGLQEVDVQGGGCMLVKMKVFDKIGAQPFAPEHEFGTDFQICIKAKKAGFKVFSDTSIELGHVKNERSIVTGANRHLHYADVADRSGRILTNATVGRVLRGFRADVMEYLGIDSVAVLLDLANKYRVLHLNFPNYTTENLKQYYIDAGSSYLARACFIRAEDNPNPFDEWIFKVIRCDVPGTGLDFGCGSAPITFELCRRGQALYFCDIPGTVPYEFLKWRAKKYGIYGIKAFFIDDPATQWPIEPQSLNYALCLDSIEHLPDGEWQSLIKKIAESLTHAGCLITNFMLLKDNENQEHIFMDKAEFTKVAVQNKLFPINSAIFQKRRDFDAG